MSPNRVFQTVELPPQGAVVSVNRENSPSSSLNILICSIPMCMGSITCCC